jgi:D-3-phosphoglycerate dehydrogenase / 2-oxoglutarate reductase
MGSKMVLFKVEPKDKSGETYRIIRDAGYELVLGRDGWDHPGDEYTEEELIELCRDADALIVGSREKITRRFMASIPKLRVISKHGTGVERIDVKAATELGILVTNTPVHSPVVAEHTVTLILGVMKKLIQADKIVRSGGWRDDAFKSTLVRDRTIGIVGFGRIGSEIAKRLQGWSVKIIAYDPYARPEVFQECGVGRRATLDELLEQSDVLSLNAVLTDETRHMIGEDQLKRMKKTAFLVNTSRGEMVDEKALIKALRERWIAGAALDVFEKEPLGPSHAFLQLDNVLMTPHMASITPEIAKLLRFTTMENALSALRGEVPKYVKNPEAIDRWRERFGKKTA